MAATLQEIPGGTTAQLAVYGLDATGAVVCMNINDSVLTGRVVVTCPEAAVTWIARIEN